jgi:hypothetical protein
MNVAQILLFVASIVLTTWAVIKNLKDASRSKSLQSQIVSIKDEFKTQSEAEKRFHADELRRLDISHKADLCRANEGRQQCESERREALEKVIHLEAKLSASPRLSKLVIHSAFYGNTPENEVSVLPKLNTLPKDAFAIYVTNNNLDADPAPNIPPKKRLRVRYSYGNDIVFETSYEESEWMVLPDPTNRKRIIS